MPAANVVVVVGLAFVVTCTDEVFLTVVVAAFFTLLIVLLGSLLARWLLVSLLGIPIFLPGIFVVLLPRVSPFAVLAI